MCLYIFRASPNSQTRVKSLRILQNLSDPEVLISGDVIGLLTLSRQLTLETFPHFVKLAENEGWLTQVALLCADEWRSRWDVREHEWTSLS